MASDEIPVGSKWRHREFGHERTVKALVSEPPTPDAIANYGRVPCVLWTEGNGPTPFDRVSTVLGKFTRIDQPKAEDPVPVGSRWRWRNGSEVLCVVAIERGEIRYKYESAAHGQEFGEPLAYFQERATRIEDASPSPLITDPGPPWTPDAFERAVVGALSKAMVDSLPTPFTVKGKDKLPVNCAPTCGPATPCMANGPCSTRALNEQRAFKRTVGNGIAAEPKPPRFAPPTPSPVGLGSLVGIYRVSVERKRVR